MLNRADQRRRQDRSLMLSVQLYAHFHNLVDAILAGDASKLSEFQQYIQYAPPLMREELLRRVDKL
jgi:hypothetical protein